MRRIRRAMAVLAAVGLVATACSGDDDSSDDADAAADDDGGGGDEGGDDGNDQTTGAGDDGAIAAATTLPAPDETGLEITRGGEISVGIVAESTGWYPPSSETAFSAGFLVMDALYDRWYDSSGSSGIIPMIAEERAVPNEDASEWTMKIREGITFHDGTDVNAAAAAEMVELWKEGPFASNVTIAETEIIDEYTIKYILKNPDPAFEQSLAGISTGAVFSPTAARAFGAEDSVENPVGTGPFMFESWTRDSEMVVVRNPNYWRTASDGGYLPYLDRIRFRVLPDAVARRASFEAGDLDIVTQGGPAGGQALIDKGFIPYEHLGNGAGVNIYNTAVPPFDDVRLRRAAAHALNPDNATALRPPNLSGVVEIRTQYYNSQSPWYDEAAGAGYAFYDPDEAQRLYDEYINDPDRSDGKDVGEPVSFTYDCNTDPINLDTAQLYQQEWGDIGFEVSINTTEQASFITKVIGTTSEPLFQGDFQIACWAEGNDNDPLQNYRTRYLDGEVLNWTNFSSPEIEAQVDILRQNLSFEERRAAAVEIARITADEMPIYWWASGTTLVLTVPEVKGVETYTYPNGEVGIRRGGGRVWWHEVWLEGATPLNDVPTDFIDIPDVPVDTTPPEPEPEEPPVNDTVAAAMPAPPAGLAATHNDPPDPEICTGIVRLEGISPISATHQSYAGDPTLGPFASISVYELAPGDADTIIGRYEQTLTVCDEYLIQSDSGPIAAGWVSRDLGSYGDSSSGYGVPGTGTGFTIDSDVIVIKTGDNLAIVGALYVIVPADGVVAGELAAAAEAILADLG